MVDSFQNSFSPFILSFLINTTVCTDNQMFSMKKHESFDDTNDPTVQQREHINLKWNLLFSLSPLEQMEGVLTTSCRICLTLLPFNNCFRQFLCIFWTVINSIPLFYSDSTPYVLWKSWQISLIISNFNSYKMLLSTKEVAL